MGFRINRGIFQYQDTASNTFINKFKIDDRGDMIEVDADGNKITTYMRLGDKSHDADLLDGVDSGSFLRSDAANSFTSTITMNTQQAFKPANFGQGVYGRYDSYRYQHVWGMGQSWHMAENGTSLGNFYGLAYTHTNIGGESKSGLSHQTLFVENGSTKTAIGSGVWTDGNITATGDANISGNLDIGGAVVGTSSGVALAVGGTSTYGVSTGDNARNQLVVSANYYPHFVIAADLNNNPNHGAVISMVGTEGSAPRQWNIGISNRNPFLFSIGYNRSGDNNPHYGVGDNWSNDDNNHARLSIDRDGNTKIRGSLYVNGTKGGITTGSKVATEAYAAGAADAVNARIEEEVLPLIDTKLDAGATAVNADTVDGYHATNAAGGIPVLNSSNAYWYAPSWMHVNEGRGIFSGTNEAHFLPNTTGQYGSWRMIGTRNGWEGLHFGDANGVTLMMNAGESGIHKNGTGWKYRHQGGKFYVHDGTNGGGTARQVIDTRHLSMTQVDNLKVSLGVTGLPYYVRITMNGDPNTFYPVHFRGGDQDVWRRIIIKRGYSWQAPSDWNTATHKGGLLLDWEGNFGGWGGARYSDRIRVFEEQYSNMVADMYRTTHSMGYTFFLRGGGDTGAIYDIFSDQAINGTHQAGSPDIAYDTDFLFYDHSNPSYVYPAPAALSLEEINRTRLDGLKTLKRSQMDALYQNAGSYLTTSGKAADSNLLDGLDSSQFLRSDTNDTMGGNLTLRYSTANSDDYSALTFAPSSNDYIIKASSSRGVFGRQSFGWHVDTASAFGVYSNGWVKLFGVKGGTGDIYVKGQISTDSYGTAQNWKQAFDWGNHAGLYDTAGASAIVNDRIETEIIPSITTAQSAANDAQAAADLAVATADTAEARANSAREDAAAAQTTADSKLGATAKAADSEAVDGVDSSRIVYGTNARRSTRYDGVGMVSPNQNSGFYYGNNPDGNPYNEWWNWITIAGASWTSGNNYDFKIAHDFHSDAMYVSRMANGTQFGWRKVIDSVNIGSQIVAHAETANYANTAGSADQIDGWGFVNTGSNSAVNADTITSNGISYYTSGVPNFSGNATDGALYSQIYSSSWQHQIAGDYRSGQIAVRGKNSNTWQAWRTVLDSSNFTSYAEPAGRIDGEVLPQIDTNTTNIARNLTSIDGKAAVSGSYGQNFYVNALYYDDWVRNHSNNNGMYWSNTGWHLYPKSSTDFYVRSGNNSECALQMYTGNTARTYLYADSSNNIGFLTASRSWALRVDNSKNTQVYNNLNVNGVISGDGSGLTNLPASTPPVEAIVEGGENSTLSSILFNPGEGSATFTLADGQTFRLAFAR